MAPRRYDAETQLLHPSKAEFKDKRPSKLATLVLRVFSGLGLVELVVDQKTGEIESSTNLTILNVFLLRLGPMREDSLTRVLIATQVSGVLFLLGSAERLRFATQFRNGLCAPCGIRYGRASPVSCLRGMRDAPMDRRCNRVLLTPWPDRSRCAVACWHSSFDTALLASCTMETDGRTNDGAYLRTHLVCAHSHVQLSATCRRPETFRMIGERRSAQSCGTNRASSAPRP